MNRPLWNGYIVNGKPLQQYMFTVLQSFFLDYSFMFRPWLTTKGSLSKVLLQRLFSKGIFLKAWFSIGYFPKGSYQRLLFPMVLSRKFSFPLIFFKYTFPKPLYKSTFLKALSKRYLSRVTFPQRVLCPKTFPRVLFQFSEGHFPKITFPKIFFSSIFLLLCLLNYQFLVFSSIFYNALKPFSWWGKHCNNFSFQKESCIQVQIEINFPNFSLILI